MKKTFFFFLVLINFIGFCQKKSNIHFFNNKGEKVSLKDAIYSETTTKINDTLWEIKRFRKNGSLFNISFSKTENDKKLIGQSISYNIKDSISSILYYNIEGQKHGRFFKWFINRNKSSEGLFQKNKKEGVWKYYHFNGNLAARGVYKNDSIVKADYFDEDGKIDSSSNSYYYFIKKKNCNFNQVGR